jgi:hypothetical protein
VPPPTGWKAWFVELAYPSPQPGLCQVYSTRVFVTPETRPFEGLAGDALVQTAGDLRPAAALEVADLRTASLLDGIFGEVHRNVLDEAAGDLDERALRYCFARDVDDLEKAVELYARLGFGQSVDDLLEQQLKDLWRDLRKDAEDLVDDAIDEVDDLF